MLSMFGNSGAPACPEKVAPAPTPGNSLGTGHSAGSSAVAAICCNHVERAARADCTRDAGSLAKRDSSQNPLPPDNSEEAR